LYDHLDALVLDGDIANPLLFDNAAVERRGKRAAEGGRQRVVVIIAEGYSQHSLVAPTKLERAKSSLVDDHRTVTSA